MNDFIKIKASKQSLARRRLIQGVGINDVLFTVHSTTNGKQRMYKPYSAWTNMFERCYSSIYQKKKPTYKGCTVCKEWHLFSNFEAWMIKQEFDGMALDKDIIKQGNKVYCPEYCSFISPSLNNLLIARDAARGDYPLGVCWDKRNKKFQANIAINGKNKLLGTFKTVEAAKAAYDSAKYAEIHRHAMLQSDPAIREGLLNWVIE